MTPKEKQNSASLVTVEIPVIDRDRSPVTILKERRKFPTLNSATENKGNVETP